MNKPGEFGKNEKFSFRTSRLVIEPTSKHNGRRRVYRLVKRFACDIYYRGGTDLVRVPEGYETDFATLPLICQLVLGNRDDYAEESVIHDWLCSNDLPRFYSNAKMRIIMTALGRPKWKILAVYYGLMIFGYKSFAMETFKRIVRRLKWSVRTE